MKLPEVLSAGARPSASLARWAPFFLRLIVGYGFMEHGYAKIARGPEHFAGILVAIGVPEPHLMSWLTILVEVVGGLAVLLGVCALVVTVPMAAILVVAALTVHLPNGFSSIKLLSVTPSGAQFGPLGYETDLLYLSCLVALVLGGSGALSIEKWLHRVRASAVRGTRTSPAAGYMSDEWEHQALRQTVPDESLARAFSEAKHDSAP
jgi:putative oxidoreductase